MPDGKESTTGDDNDVAPTPAAEGNKPDVHQTPGVSLSSSSSHSTAREELGRRALFIMISHGVGSVTGYLSLFLMLRWVGTTSVGLLGFGLAYVGLFMMFGDFGFATSHVKRIAEGRDEKRCVGTYLAIRMALAGTFLVLSVGGLVVWKYVLGWGFEHAETELVVLILAGYTALILVADVIRTTFQAKLQMVRAHAPVIAENLVRTALIVFVAWSFTRGSPPTPELAAVGIAYAYLAGGFVYLLGYIVQVRQLHVGRPDRETFRSYWAFALPITVALAAGLITANLDKVLLQFFGSADDVGRYLGVQKLTIMLQQFSIAFSVVLAPAMQRKAVARDIARLKRFSHVSERYYSLLALPGLVLMIVIPSQIIHILLSDDILPAARVLALLAMTMYVGIVTIPYNLQFTALDRPGLVAWISMVQLVVNVALNILLIPDSLFGVRLAGWGIEGAAFAFLAAILVANLSARLGCYHLTGTGFHPQLAKHFAAAIAMAGVVYLLTAHMLANIPGAWGQNYQFYHLLITALVGLGSFALALAVVGELRREDLRLFGLVLHPSRFFRYIAKEARQTRKEIPGKDEADEEGENDESGKEISKNGDADEEDPDDEKGESRENERR
ncbi:MAG TPA: oligosaccharide flippase family protein [Thermoplasmata archaeon]|nr:oligosaccharide flippase family protein [Thermoplasmata archaeon]